MPHAKKVLAFQSTQTKRNQTGKKLLETILLRIGRIINAAVSHVVRNKNWILFHKASLSSKSVRNDTVLN